MKITALHLLQICVVILFCSNATAAEKWRPLFNGLSLDGWDTYLGTRYSKAKEDFDGEPIGLNVDPYKVFTVVKQNGEGIIRISGEHYGGISTKEEFENYHLKLQFKWGEDKYAPREKAKRDSGLLYHAYGKHGDEWFFWMKSLELQIQEGDCGDYWALGPIADITAVRPKGNKDYQYVKGGPLVTIDRSTDTGGHVIKADNGNSEKPNGEWNTVELYTVKNNSVHIVNGVVKMVIKNARVRADGKERALTKGKIQIQSEGAEVYYRNIEIRKIDAIPAKYLK